MTKNHSRNSGKQSLKIIKVGHSTVIIELAGLKILTDPWFTDPILGIVTHARAIRTDVADVPKLGLILISHGHFDHCDLKAMAKFNKDASVIVPDTRTAARIRKLGYPEVTVLSPWESRLVSGVCVTALPAEHPVPECTYVVSYGDLAVYFGGDTRYVKELQEVGEKFDLTAALLPVNGLRFPVLGKVVMDPVDAAEAAIQLKARVVIPIHCNISLTVPFLKQFFERGITGTPEGFAAEIRKRNRHVKVVMLRPGESWVSD